MMYDAFISYSHAADSKLAAAFQAGLQGLSKPWYRRRSVRVFRDKTNLSATPELWSSIELALRNSRYLILMASPESARSPWVDRELTFWRDNKSLDSLLIVLTAGELAWDNAASTFLRSNCRAIPDSLVAAIVKEPLWVDLTSIKTSQQMSLANGAFRDAVVSIDAVLLGKTKDEVESDDLRHHRRTIRLAWLVGIVLALLAATSTLSAIRANKATLESQSRLAQAYLKSGSALLDGGWNADAALWFAEALRLAQEDPQQEMICRHRLSMVLNQFAIPRAVLYHDGPVYDVSVSPDGKLIATASDDMSARVWDLSTGEPTAAPIMHPGSVVSVRFSPDGRRIVTGTQPPQLPLAHEGERMVEIGQAMAGGTQVPLRNPDDPHNSVGIWEAVTGRALAPQLHLPGPVISNTVDPTGKIVFTVFDSQQLMSRADGDRESTLGHSLLGWDAETGRPLGNIESDVNSVTFSPRGDGLAVFTMTHGSLVIADGHKGIKVSLGSPVIWAGFSNDGRRVMALIDNSSTVNGPLIISRRGEYGEPDVTAIVLDAASGKRLAPPFLAKQAHNVTFSSDGNKILAAGHGKMRVWSAMTGEPVSPEMSALGVVSFAQFSQDGRKLLVSEGNTVTVLDADSGRPWTLDLYHESEVWYASFALNDRFIVTGSGNHGDGRTGAARVWDLTLGHRSESVIPQPVSVRHLSFRPDSQGLLTEGDDGVVRGWDLATQRAQFAIRPSGQLVFAAYRPDGQQILTATADGVGQFWDLTGHEVGKSTEQQEGLLYESWSPDGWLIVATGGHNGSTSTQLWNARTHEAIGSRIDHNGFGGFNQFSPDGRRVMTLVARRVAGSQQLHGLGQVWIVTSRGLQLKGTFSKDTVIQTAEFSPDGRKIVSASSDGGADLWDGSNASHLGPGIKLSGNVRNAQFHPNSRWALLLAMSPTSKYPELNAMWSQQYAQMWDMVSARPISPRIDVHPPNASFPELSRDGLFLVTVRTSVLNSGSFLQFRDAASGDPMSPPIEYENVIAHGSFSPDGASFAAAIKNEVRVWDLKTIDWPASELVALAELLAGKQLSPAGYLVPLSSKEIALRLKGLRSQHPTWFAAH